MLTFRKSEDRGTATNDWRQSYHSFSFGHYQDPAHTHIGALRVLNEDHVTPD